MCRNRFNAFDPFLVVRDLLTHRDWWGAAVMDRHGDLIKLRDVPAGRWNVDRLYLLALAEKTPLLKSIAERWKADEVHELTGKDTDKELGIGRGEHPHRILWFWWD